MVKDLGFRGRDCKLRVQDSGLDSVQNLMVQGEPGSRVQGECSVPSKRLTGVTQELWPELGLPFRVWSLP